MIPTDAKSDKTPIVAVASIGGHWIQLLRICTGLSTNFEITFVSTHPDCAKMVIDSDFFNVSDFSRWNAYKIVPVFFKFAWKFLKKRPTAVLTTGAAPGLTALLAAKLLGIKTIWIDSIANVEHLSFSGRIASKFVSRIYTQWPELATDKIIYAGNVLNPSKK